MLLDKTIDLPRIPGLDDQRKQFLESMKESLGRFEKPSPTEVIDMARLAGASTFKPPTFEELAAGIANTAKANEQANRDEFAAMMARERDQILADLMGPAAATNLP